ncbi:MAG: protein kinase domain-containing protein [Planktothrix sp.]
MAIIPGQTQKRLALFSAVLLGATLCPTLSTLLGGTTSPALISTLANMVSSVFGGLVANDMGELAKRLETKDTSNHDLAKATGEAISLIIRNLAELNGIDKTTQKSLKKLAEITQKEWSKISAKPNHSNVSLNITDDDLVRLMSAKASDFAKVTALTEDIWEEIVRILDNLAKTHLTDDWILKLASQLHHTFPQGFREILKVDAARGGKAYAAMSLSLMGEIAALSAERGNFSSEQIEQIKKYLEQANQDLQSEQKNIFCQVMVQIESGFNLALESTKQEIICEIQSGFQSTEQKIDKIYLVITQISDSLHQKNINNNLQQISPNLKYNYSSFLQENSEYFLQEKNIADILIARNLPGLFERLLELKGLSISEKYTLRWLYAVGGQSIVYLAEKNNGDLVIVKIPYLDYHRPAYISIDKINKSRSYLIQEAELLKKLNYMGLPNFTELIYNYNPLHADYRDHAMVNGEPFLVMEFISGVNLLKFGRYIHNQSSIDYGTLERIVWKTLSEITDFCITLSTAGYLYSDINPLNFILASNFSLIRILDAGSLIPLNPESHITPPFTESYIPVEYFNAYDRGQRMYPNSQYLMYALGKMLWEILTNKQPYPGEHPNLFEPVFQQYSPEIRTTIRYLIQNGYRDFNVLRKTINSFLV